MFTSRAEYRILLRQDDADVRLTPKAYKIGLADERRYQLLQTKLAARDRLIEFCRNFSVRAAVINPRLEAAGYEPLKQGQKLYELLLRPNLDIATLAPMIEPLKAEIDAITPELRDEVVEAAEILIKYQGYIDRERLIADKLNRLEEVRISDRFDYSTITAISTEARQKLAKHHPETIGEASRIPGISPSDINILLLLMNR